MNPSQRHILTDLHLGPTTSSYCHPGTKHLIHEPLGDKHIQTVPFLRAHHKTGEMNGKSMIINNNLNRPDLFINADAE